MLWMGMTINGTCALDPAVWAHANFSECDFNDQRLTKRMVHCAELCANRPNDSTPLKCKNGVIAKRCID